MLFELFSQIIIHFIQKVGYAGIFILMALESTIIPVPSEIVMPFAGFLVSSKELSFFWVALISTFGTIFGSLLSYFLGRYGGHKLVKKIGKYVFLNEEHLLKTEAWFVKHGEKTIFVSRFLPIVRHLISIPAGIGKMNKKYFLLYTFLGAFLWNSFLTYLGIILKNNWEVVHKYTQVLDILFVLLFLIVIIVYITLHLKKKHEQRTI